jgi:ribosome-associated translation inhibitor RaiA
LANSPDFSIVGKPIKANSESKLTEREDNADDEDDDEEGAPLHGNQIQYLGSVKPNNYIYDPIDHEVQNQNNNHKSALTGSPAVAGAQEVKARALFWANASSDPQVTPHVIKGRVEAFEYPSAVPPPLRRTSRVSANGAGSPPSLRERYLAKEGDGGLGINLKGADGGVGVDLKKGDDDLGVGLDEGDGDLGVDLKGGDEDVGVDAKGEDDGLGAELNGGDGALSDSDSRSSQMTRDFAVNGFGYNNDSDSEQMTVEQMRAEIHDTVMHTDHLLGEVALDTFDRLYMIGRKLDGQRHGTEVIKDKLDRISESVDATGTAFAQSSMNEDKTDAIAKRVIEALQPTMVKLSESIDKTSAESDGLLVAINKCHDTMAKEIASLKNKADRTLHRLGNLEARVSSMGQATTHADLGGMPASDR